MKRCESIERIERMNQRMNQIERRTKNAIKSIHWLRESNNQSDGMTMQRDEWDEIGMAFSCCDDEKGQSNGASMTRLQELLFQTNSIH